MITPKKTKYFKSHKPIITGKATVGCEMSFGSYGLKVLDNVKISAKQIEAIRKVVSRTMKRTGLLYIRIFPQIPVTKKPLAVRMGGGKGPVESWVAPVYAGTIIMEIDNVDRALAYEALEKVRYKLSVNCRVVERKFAYL